MLRKFFVGLLEWLIVIWVVFEYHTLYNDFVNNKQMYIPGAVLLGLLILLTIDFRKLRAEILVGYFVLMFIPLSFQGNKLIYTFIYLILVSEFYVAFRCCNLTSGQLTLFYKFAKVMTFVGGTSVFLWLMVSVLNIWQMNGYLPSSWGNRGVVESFYYYYAETQKLNFSGLTVVRNTAFFNEAPVYNICLCSASYVETGRGL